MTDLFDGTNPAEDRLEVDGECVATRESLAPRIEQRARDKNIPTEEAWAEIRAEVLQYHQGKGASAKRGSSQQPEKPNPVDSVAAPVIERHGKEYRLRLDGNALPELSDDMLPKELQERGMGIMDALANGLLKIDGEHPLAEALRQTTLLSLDPNSEAGTRAMQKVTSVRPSIQYPLLRQSVRVMPSDFNKTSLFHVGSNNLPRRFCKNEKLGHIGNGVTMYYYGEELRQTDEAIFRQLIHVARGKAPWEWIYLEQCPFVRDAKGTTRHLGGRDLKEVNDIIMRMRTGLLLIQNKRRKGFITCNLIREYEGVGQERRLMLDPRVVLLFDSYAAIEDNVLTDLSAVAQKIYSYTATVQQTSLYPILVTSLFELCYGRTQYLEKEYLRRNPTRSTRDAELSVQKKFSDFKRKILPNALDELMNDKGLIASWSWEEKKTKVTIVKNPETNAIVTEASPEEEQAG